MNKMLVAVFKNETIAYEGLSALIDLQDNGDLTLHATAVISKNEKGELQLKSAAEGSLVGAATGLLVGLEFEINSCEANIKCADEISCALANGKTAIVAEIDESWMIPVDTGLSNGMVFRRLRNEVLEVQLARESKAISAEYQKLNEEFIQAGQERRAHIQSVILKLQEKAQAINNLLNRKLKDTKDELEAKVDATKVQMKDAKGIRKEKMGKRIEELKADYTEKTKKLKQVEKLVREAFTSKRTL